VWGLQGVKQFRDSNHKYYNASASAIGCSIHNNVEASYNTTSTEFDMIVGSDIIYLEEMLAPLWITIDALLSPTGVMWLAYSRRNVSIDLVVNAAARHDFILQEAPSVEHMDGMYVFCRCHSRR
jgi:hypothetical protein